MDEVGSPVHNVDTDKGRYAPRRTRNVVIASAALVGLGLLGVLLAWVLLSVLNDEADHGQSVGSWLYALCYVQVVLSGTQVVSGLFIWRGGHRWARLAALVICVVNLLSGVVTLLSGNIFQGLFGTAMNGALIGLLRNDDLYDWCHGPYGG
jgi:MFS family permease